MKINIILFQVFLFNLLFSFVHTVHAQVVINEFSSGTTDDWVELYNVGTASANLSEYRLRDSTVTNKKDLSGSLDGNAFISFDFSNYLNNTGDKIQLFKILGDNQELVNEITYGSSGGICAATESQSIGRQPDGGSTIVLFSATTRNAANTSSNQTCSSPTPTPVVSPSPSPTPQLSFAPTANPTASPKKLLNSSPPSRLINSSPSIEPDAANVLGEALEASPFRTSPSPGNLMQESSSRPWGLVFLGIGIILSGVGGYIAFRRLE